MQMSCSSFDIKVFVLSCSAFDGEHRATMNVDEVAIWEFVPLLGILRLLIVDTQMPFCVLFKSVLIDELIFLLSGRLVVTPCVSLVAHKTVFVHQSLSMIECGTVELDCHIFLHQTTTPTFNAVVPMNIHRAAKKFVSVYTNKSKI